MNCTHSFIRSLTYSTFFLPVTCLMGCGNQGNPQTTRVGPDITAPTVSATTPSLAAQVATSANVKVLFSEAMDGATITPASFTLAQGTTPVLATVSYERSVATLTPIANLSGDTLFTATIHTGAKDKAGNALAANRTWTFTTINTAATLRTAMPDKDAV